MITSVLFVHGTGVRKAAYEASAARISQGLAAVAPTVRLAPCLWGDALGAKLGKDGRSIPDFSGVAPPSAAEEQTLALWELLSRDPLFELRELAAQPPAGLVPPAEVQHKLSFMHKLGKLEQAAAPLSLLAGRVLAVQWQQTVPMVADAAALKAALAAAAKVDTALRVAASRALVAALQQQLADDNMPVLAQTMRDALVESCVTELGGRELGLKDWISGRLVGFGLRWATAKARRERDGLFNAAYPAAGDILLYQARGQPIRDEIAARLADCSGDVAIFAHSLGGIACVDLLVQRALPQVKLLVTVGSQAPFLYEIGALCSLKCGEPLPPHFPPRWLNFYDPNDLLSYSAARLFSGHAVDHRIDSGQPFPHSHSAYWDVPKLWEKLGPALCQ